MNRLKWWFWCLCLTVSAALGCSGAPLEAHADGEARTETVEYYSFGERTDGTWEEVAFYTYEREAPGVGTAAQPLLACNWADNETFYLGWAANIQNDPAIWPGVLTGLNAFNQIANTTGVIATPLAAGNNYDAYIQASVQAGGGHSPGCADSLDSTPCVFGAASCAVKDGRRSQCTIYIMTENIKYRYVTASERSSVLRRTLLHELGHTQGLQHFVSGPICTNTTGVGTLCPWGSKPGGKDTVMSYCAHGGATLGYDGCELEELYWNINTGPEKNGGDLLFCDNGP
jgi:hypothetical protein